MKNQPSQSKFRKYFERFEPKIDHTRHVLRFGDYGIKAIKTYPKQKIMLLTSAQIEATWRVLTKNLRDGDGGPVNKKVKMWSMIFPDRTMTKLAAESGMGKGKGNVHTWAARVRPGMVIYEFSNVSEQVAKAACKVLQSKLPFHAELIKRPKMIVDHNTLMGLKLSEQSNQTHQPDNPQ